MTINVSELTELRLVVIIEITEKYIGPTPIFFSHCEFFTAYRSTNKIL